MSHPNNPTSICMSDEDFERRMSNLEKKLGYTWCPKPTRMKPPTLDPVQPIICPSKPSKEDELIVDVVMNADECQTKLVIDLKEDERIMVKPFTELFSSVHLKLAGNHQVSERLNLEEALSHSLVVVCKEIAESGFVASSHVWNVDFSVCIPSVCENASEIIISDFYFVGDCTDVVSCSFTISSHFISLWVEGPPPMPPEISSFFSIYHGLLMECSEPVSRLHTTSYFDCTVKAIEPWCCDYASKSKILQFNLNSDGKTFDGGVIVVRAKEELVCYITTKVTFNEFFATQLCKHAEKGTHVGYYVNMVCLDWMFETTVGLFLNGKWQSSSMYIVGYLLHIHTYQHYATMRFEFGGSEWLTYMDIISEKVKHWTFSNSIIFWLILKRNSMGAEDEIIAYSWGVDLSFVGIRSQIVMHCKIALDTKPPAKPPDMSSIHVKPNQCYGEYAETLICYTRSVSENGADISYLSIEVPYFIKFGTSILVTDGLFNTKLTMQRDTRHKLLDISSTTLWIFTVHELPSQEVRHDGPGVELISFGSVPLAYTNFTGMRFVLMICIVSFVGYTIPTVVNHNSQQYWFAMPRPPEMADLEDKVCLKGEGMLRPKE